MSSFFRSLVMTAYHGVFEPLRALRLKRARLAAFGLAPRDPLPSIAIDPSRSQNCSPACGFEPTAREAVLARYLEPPSAAVPPRFRLTPTAIELARFSEMTAFEALIRKRSSRTLPKARRALKDGYTARRFPMRLHVEDIFAVKTSMRTRAAGPVLDYWLLRPEHVGRQATAPLAYRPPACPNHWTIWWGAFEPAPGHTQGGAPVGERLVAYVKAIRIGGLVHYADIMGHRDHLERGVMILIHLEIMRWMIESGDPAAAGVRAVLYGGAEHGREGLLTWKKRAGFEPTRLTLAPSRGGETARPGR